MSLSVESGAFIRNARLAKGMSQKELAYLIDIDIRHIYNIEYGRAEPTLRTLIAIARVLDFSLDALKPFAVHDENGVYWKSLNV